MIKDLLRGAFARLGYRVTRMRPENRFNAMSDALAQLAAADLRPRVIIDAGANLGQWARLARAQFPDAHLHSIEPQEVCHATLQQMARVDGRMTVHPLAVTAPGVGRVRLVGEGTGAWVSTVEGRELPAATLDERVQVSAEDRALLKLDLEGHELEALRGAERLLESVEVVLIEVQLYDIEDRGRPCAGDLVRFLDQRGFELYDVASLSPRPRDGRLRQADLVLIQRGSALGRDRAWE